MINSMGLVTPLLEVVRFAHFSVKEYLIFGRSKVFTTSPILSHEYIGDFCVSMLLQYDRFQDEITDDFRHQSPLFEYAAHSWFLHIKQLEDDHALPAGLSYRSCQLLDRRPGYGNYHTWIKAYDSILLDVDRISRRLFGSTMCLPVLLSCCVRLASATHYFIQTGVDINE